MMPGQGTDGADIPRPHTYAIYTQAQPDQRKTFPVATPTYRWVRPPTREA